MNLEEAGSRVSSPTSIWPSESENESSSKISFDLSSPTSIWAPASDTTLFSPTSIWAPSSDTVSSSRSIRAELEKTV